MATAGSIDCFLFVVPVQYTVPVRTYERVFCNLTIGGVTSEASFFFLLRSGPNDLQRVALYNDLMKSFYFELSVRGSSKLYIVILIRYGFCRAHNCRYDELEKNSVENSNFSVLYGFLKDKNIYSEK